MNPPPVHVYGLKLQFLGKISNISAADPPPPSSFLKVNSNTGPKVYTGCDFSVEMMSRATLTSEGEDKPRGRQTDRQIVVVVFNLSMSHADITSAVIVTLTPATRRRKR